MASLMQNVAITALVVVGLLIVSSMVNSNPTAKQTAGQFQRLSNVLGGK